jgi:hypothetical protein
MIFGMHAKLDGKLADFRMGQVSARDFAVAVMDATIETMEKKGAVECPIEVLRLIRRTLAEMSLIK